MVSSALLLRLLLSSLVISTAAAEIPDSLSICSKECPVTTYSKLNYETKMTYTYSYRGISTFKLEEVADGMVVANWNAQVKLTVLSHCDIAISIINPSIEGGIDEDKVRLLEEYPIVIAMIDGRVQNVCIHPDDDTWSINLKKGIASALQNSLPSNSTANSGLILTETDVVGKCPTKYELQQQGSNKITVLKTKNHRLCQERYLTPDELPTAWLKAPIPFKESGSVCQQEITGGVFTSIICDDKNLIQPAFGFYKYVKTNVHSELRFIQKDYETHLSILNLRHQALVHKTLHYEHQTARKDGKVLAQLDQTMREICEKVQETIERDVAKLMAKVMHILIAIPDENVEEILQNIRAGQYCRSYHRLENIFLDALAFIREPSAVRLMVDELVSGRASLFRNVLYTAAFFFSTRPSKESLDFLQHLFESSNPQLRFAALGAAAMVSTYCRHHPNCYVEAPIKRLTEVLGRKIHETCSLSEDESYQEEVITSLKTLGNIGVMTTAVSRKVMRCLQKENVKRNIRVAAAQAFRQVGCEVQPTSQLLAIATNSNQDTEIRIASYLAAIRCVSRGDLQDIVTKIDQELNTQVRGFIFSHLSNLQQSTAPHKENIKYHLSSISLPDNFTCDFRRYSRNIDLSFYNDALGLGIGIESDIIYVPGSFIPQSMSLNLTAYFGDTFVNLGEYGVRIEGMEPIIRYLIGPEGYLRKTALSTILRDLFSLLEGKDMQIFGGIKDEISTSWSQISVFLEKIYKRSKTEWPKLDIYARLNDQEVTYTSFTGNPMHLKFGNYIETFQEFLRGLMNARYDKTYMGQLYLEYHLSTVQGMPLILKLDGTSVSSLEMENNLRNIRERDKGCVMKIKPSISIYVDGFLGFDSVFGQNGLRSKTLISSNNGISFGIISNRQNNLDFIIDLPKTMELLNTESDTYLMKVIGKEEVKYETRAANDIRYTSSSCNRMFNDLLGLSLCYHINIPDVFRSTVLPLGRSSVVKLFIEKADPNLEGYLLKTSVQNNSNVKIVNAKLEPLGPPSSAEGAEGTYTYSWSQESVQISTTIKSVSFIYHGKVILLDIPDQRSFSFFYQFKEHSTEFSKGIKIEFNDNSEYTREFNVFISATDQFSLESQIFESKLVKQGSGNEMTFDMFARSKNDLLKYLDMNFDIGGELCQNTNCGPFLPVQLRNFEFHIQVGQYKVLSYLHLIEDSVYTTAFIAYIGNMELLSIKGKHSFAEETVGMGMTTENNISGTFGSDVFTVMFNLENRDLQRSVLFTIIHANSGDSLLHLEVLLELSGTTYTAKCKLDIPTCMQAIDFESMARGNGSNYYQIESKLHHGRHLILHFEGPVVLTLTSKLTHIQTDVSISLLGHDHQRISFGIIFSKSKKVVSLNVRNNEASVFAIEWKMENGEKRPVSFGFNFHLRTVLTSKVIVQFGQRFVHVSIDNVVLPDTQASIRYKGFIDADGVARKVIAVFSWNADFNPSRNIRAEVSIHDISSTVRQCVISGGWMYMDRLYNFKSEIDIKDPQIGFTGMNIVKTEITTPLQKKINLEIQCQIERTYDFITVTTITDYKNTDNKKYRLNTETKLNNLGRKFNYILTTAVNYIPDEGLGTSFDCEVRHQTVAGLGEFVSVINLNNPLLSKPIEVNFTVTKQQQSYNALWNIGVSTPARGFNLEVVITPETGLKTFDVGLDVTVINELLHSIREILHLESHCSPSNGEVAKKLIYHFRYDQFSVGSTTFMIEFPSRTLICEAEISPAEHIYRIYPNRKVSDSRYELLINKVHDQRPWAGLEFQGLFRHPRRNKDLKMEIQFYQQRDKITGKLELDIFPHSKDKIVGLITSTMLSEESVKIEVDVSGKILKVTPKIVIGIATTSQTKEFSISVWANSSQPPVTSLFAKYDCISDKSSAVAVTLFSRDQPVLKMARAINIERSPTFAGRVISGALESRVIGNYDINAHIGSPGVFQLTAQNADNGLSHTLYIGLQGPSSVKIGIEVDDPETLETKPLVMARATLETQRRVSLGLWYGAEEYEAFQRTAARKWHRVHLEFKNWLLSICSEFFSPENASDATLTEMGYLWQETMEEVSLIVQEIVEDANMLKGAVVNGVFKNRLAQGLFRNNRALWNQMKLVMHHVTVFLSKTVSSISREFDVSLATVEEAIRGDIHSLQKGKIPESLQYLFELVIQSNVYKTLEAGFGKVMLPYPEESEALRQMLSKAVASLGEDLKKFSIYIQRIPEVQRSIKWALRNLDLGQLLEKEAEKAIYRIVQNTVLLALETEPNSIQLVLPLRSSAISLTQALTLSYNPFPILDDAPWTYFPSKDVLTWDYYTLFPLRNIYELPPYNRTAMLIGAHEILTFDGAVLRAPSSPCKVLLFAYRSSHLVMEHPNTQAPPRLRLEASGVTVVINPDYEVVVNDIDMNLPCIIQGDVQVWKTPTHINVTTPFMFLHVSLEVRLVSVEITGWAFGQVAGLLGTYDGEVSNDWLMLNGTKATLFQELVTSWQEDRNCRVPEIDPVTIRNTPFKQVVLCQAVVGMVSQCSALINPDSFLSICYGTRNICDVVQAMRLLCSFQGIQVPFTYAC